MLPTQLQAEQFDKYPPEAKRIVIARIAIMQQLPLTFLALLLREVIAYDWKFPAERRELDRQLAYMGSLSADQIQQLMGPFAQLHLSPELEQMDWINSPQQFSEQLTAHLWATHQLDIFRQAALRWGQTMDAATPPEPASMPRLVIVAIGRGVTENDYPLFRKLRPWGVYFKHIKSANGNAILLEAVASRARAHPVPFGHWYIDGAASEAISSPEVTCISYNSVDPVRTAIVALMRRATESGSGPEALRTLLAQLRPDDLGLNGAGSDGILNRFQISVLAEGSGTQLFSTTFVQWSAREALRRAQPLTLLARFAPRQRERSMNELLGGTKETPQVDPQASLIDADMGAYYTWINQQRLSGAEQSCCLVWFEDHGEALAIGPSLPRGTQSDTPLDLHEVLGQML